MRLSKHTPNLSGEASEYCPKCGQKSSAASPVKNDNGRRRNPQDEELRRLERLAAQGDPAAAEKLRQLRDRLAGRRTSGMPRWAAKVPAIRQSRKLVRKCPTCGRKTGEPVTVTLQQMNDAVTEDGDVVPYGTPGSEGMVLATACSRCLGFETGHLVPGPGGYTSSDSSIDGNSWEDMDGLARRGIYRADGFYAILSGEPARRIREEGYLVRYANSRRRRNVIPALAALAIGTTGAGAASAIGYEGIGKPLVRQFRRRTNSLGMAAVEGAAAGVGLAAASWAINQVRGKKQNPGTLADAAEQWASARGMRLPARGTPAWQGMYAAWQRGGMRRNPVDPSGYGVFPWISSGIYKASQVVRIFKREQDAQRLASKMTDDGIPTTEGRGWVVRTMRYVQSDGRTNPFDVASLAAGGALGVVLGSQTGRKIIGAGADVGTAYAERHAKQVRTNPIFGAMAPLMLVGNPKWNQGDVAISQRRISPPRLDEPGAAYLNEGLRVRVEQVRYFGKTGRDVRGPVAGGSCRLLVRGIEEGWPSFGRTYWVYEDDVAKANPRGGRAPIRRRNDASKDGFVMRLPSDRVLGTMPLAEARRKWGGQVKWGESSFEDFHGGAQPSDEVILWDDGNEDVRVGWVAGTSPEVTYGGAKTDVPDGSVKDDALYVHKTGEESGNPTYLVGIVPKRAAPGQKRPITRDFMLLGNMRSDRGWLRD